MLTINHLFLSVACLMLLSACNTMEGLGQDVETGGDMIEDSASETKDEMPRE